MTFSVLLKLLPCIGGSSAAPEEEPFIRPRPRRPSNPMVIEYKPAYERASQEQAAQERAVPVPSSTDGDASGSDDASPPEDDARVDDNEGDVCLPAPITDAFKVKKSKHAVESWLEQQDALLREQQQRYVHAQSDAEIHTVGSHTSHGEDDATSPDDDATSSDDDQATLLAVPLERPVRHRLTIDSLREVARSVRGSTAMAARSLNRRFTVDSLRDFARGSSSAPEMQGPNEKAARVLDIYGTESSRIQSGVGSSRVQKTSFFARVFRRKAKAGDREKKRLSLFDW
ncbi:hypothetical protein EV714DRAFT_221176 [Schizophyllum commune]